MNNIKEILSKNKTIAMIGVSKDPTKPSTIVMKYMQNYGFKVIPINPRAKGEKILGEEVFVKSLLAPIRAILLNLVKISVVVFICIILYS